MLGTRLTLGIDQYDFVPFAYAPFGALAICGRKRAALGPPSRATLIGEPAAHDFFAALGGCRVSLRDGCRDREKRHDENRR
jgi:hypothetical protein